LKIEVIKEEDNPVIIIIRLFFVTVSKCQRIYLSFHISITIFENRFDSLRVVK